MRTILLATDFSENSKAAAKYAIKLFGTNNVKYLLVNTYYEISAATTIVASMNDYLREQSLEGLKDQSDELKNLFSGLNVDTHTYYGEPARTIGLAAKEEGVEYIVVGTKGASALENFLIGSNTLEIVKSIETPIIMVPGNWSHDAVHQVTFATDLHHLNNVHVLRKLKSVVEKTKAPLVLLNVSERPVGYEEALEGFELHNELEGVDHSFVNVIHSDIVAGIDEYVGNHHVDLLALVARKHTFMERIFRKSVTAELSKMAHVPMLVLREN